MERCSLFDEKWRIGRFRPQINAYYYKQWLNFQMDDHAHASVEIMYIISGTCVIQTEQEHIAMHKGDFILLDSGVTHRLVLERDVPCRMLNVEFTFAECEDSSLSLAQLTAASPALGKLLDRRDIAYVTLSDPSDVYHTLKSLVLELDASATADEKSLVQLLMSQLLIQIARLVQQQEHVSRPTDHYARQAVEYIHQHYDGELQAKHIAAAICLHPVYLQRIFRKSMQISMADYIAQVRVDKAKMLLARTDIPLAEIADYVGLNSRQYFSELFKKLTGTTPAAYRSSVEANFWEKSGEEVAIVDNLE
ncbi:helix-turn-helix domain-containing protein [Paenibacillus sp. GCM10027626]|uniref:AraC family transcriptional regulator n=1 Tax=Paenibacillus sp. GCM10027626 TaxID=3273411 RepID=UPI003633D7D1